MFWLFDSGSGKRITRDEFRREVVPRLRDRGLSHDDINFLEATVSGSLQETGGQSGVDARELETVLETLRRDAPDHLSKENLDRIEEELRRALES